MPEPPKVLVLEAASKASLPVIESAWRQGNRVIAAAPTRVCAGNLSRYVSQRVLSPNAVKEPTAYQDWLIAFLSQNDVEMVYPTGDAATDLVAQIQDEVRKHSRLVIAHYDSFRAARDKVSTMHAAARSGVPIPRTWYPKDGGFAHLKDEIVFPSLIKPALSAGARGIVFLDDYNQLEREYPQIVAEYGESYVQEFVPGVQQKADVVIGPSGELVSGVVYDKLRFYPPAGGSSVLNETVDRPDILHSAGAILAELDWYGFCDFDFITDERDGVAKLIEINPRFPESFRATMAAGVDQVHLLWQLAHDIDLEPDLEYELSRRLRFLPGDVMWLLTSGGRERKAHLGSWLTFLSRNLTYQVCSLRDPGPIIGYLAENVVQLSGKESRASRFRLGQARSNRDR